MPLPCASSSTAGNSPISNSKANMSTRDAPRLRHSVMTSSTNSRPTGKLIGPMTTRRPFRAPWKKPSWAACLRFAKAGGLVGTQDQFTKLAFLLGEGSLLCCACRHPTADIQIRLPFVAAEVQHFEGAKILLCGLLLALHADQPLARGVNGEFAEVSGDPLAPKLFGHGSRGAEPQKKSATRSPSLLLALIIRSRSASGFWVG